jgi:hypothetical protein
MRRDQARKLLRVKLRYKSWGRLHHSWLSVTWVLDNGRVV